MHEVKGLQMLSRRNIWKSFTCDRGPIVQVTNKKRISHSLGLKKSTANLIRLKEMVVLDMCQPEMCFDRLEKQP